MGRHCTPPTVYKIRSYSAVLRKGPRAVKWLLTVDKMDRDTGSESESTSSESPIANTTGNSAFSFASSERGQSVPHPLKVTRSVGSSSSEDDDGEEADRRTDISSTSSGESNAEKTSAGKGLVTYSTSQASAVATSVLYGKSLALRSSLRSSSSFGGEGDSPSHESDDTEFGSAHAHKRQASDASESSPPPPKRILQMDTGDGATETFGGAEYSDFARRMMVG